jgi:hypothetical protein
MVTANDSLFTANGVKAITGPLANTFNEDFIDSVNFLTVVVSGNTTAENGQTYVNVASATYTDPTPAEGKGYTVFVRNGTATVGGIPYAVKGVLVYRVYHSGSWANYEIGKTAYSPTPYSAGAIAPTAFFDASAGYIVGYTYKDLTTGLTYICIDNTNDSAAWQPLSGALSQTPGGRYTTLSDLIYSINGDTITVSGSFIYDDSIVDIGNAIDAGLQLSRVTAVAIGEDGKIIPLEINAFSSQEFGFAPATSCLLQTYYYAFTALLA